MAQLELRGLSGKEFETAFAKLEAALTHGIKPTRMTLYSPGAANSELDAYWHPGDGYWVTFEPDAAMGKRWCSYGVVNPAVETRQTMLCQINVQAVDPWKPMGAFATDGRATYYLHNGRLARYTSFADRYPGQKALVRWDGHAPATYFIVAKLGSRRAAAQLGRYVRAIANYKGGAALEETYRGAFEEGLAQAVRELEVRLGGADTRAGVEVASASGSLEDMGAARSRLAFLRQLQEKLRYDPYLLAAPVGKISSNVQAERRRRLIYSIGAAVLSTGAGWLLSTVSPGNALSLLQGAFGWIPTLLSR